MPGRLNGTIGVRVSDSVKLPEVFDLTGVLKLGLHSSIKAPTAFPASKVLSYSDTN